MGLFFVRGVRYHGMSVIIECFPESLNEKNENLPDSDDFLSLFRGYFVAILSLIFACVLDRCGASGSGGAGLAGAAGGRHGATLIETPQIIRYLAMAYHGRHSPASVLCLPLTVGAVAQPDLCENSRNKLSCEGTFSTAHVRLLSSPAICQTYPHRSQAPAGWLRTYPAAPTFIWCHKAISQKRLTSQATGCVVCGGVWAWGAFGLYDRSV